MAITRSQQAKQMLQNGGRIGLRGGGADMGRERGSVTGREPGPVGGGRGIGPSRDGGSTNRERGIMRSIPQAATTAQRGSLSDPREKQDVFQQPSRFNVLDFIPGVGLIRRLSDILPPGGKPFDANRFPGGGGDSQGIAGIPTWMRLGFSSEAEYLASLEQDEDKNKEAEEGLRLAFRADGGPIGGEYDFESARQMYGLGKLVKKVTRTVKKIAKSPVGKAAIAYGLFKGFKNPAVQKFLFGLPSGNPIVAPTKGLFGVGGQFALGKGSLGVGTLIAGTSLAAGLLTADQEKEAQELSRGEGIDIEAARRSILARAQGNFAGDRRATAFLAEGGRIGLRNGGDDDDADDQESSYDDGPLLIPDDADLSPDDFYGRKEREGIMKMASAPDPTDSLNDMAQMLFGKNLDQLTDDEYIELLDAARDSMSEGGSMKEREGIMKMASYGYDDAMGETFEEFLRLKRIGEIPADMEFDEYMDLLDIDIPLSKKDKDSPSIKLAEGGKPEPVAKKTMPLLDMGGKEMDLREEGGFVPIGRMEKADDVPARLSKNEFVFTADAVRNAGDGDVDKGAEVMYNMMKNLEAGGEVSEESQGLEGARKMFQTSQRLEEVL